MKNRKPSNPSQKPGIKEVKPHASSENLDDKGERIQKTLARGGIASRREIERCLEK